MSKRSNPMAVKAVLSYDVSEAARALGKSQATIRNWIRDGLPVMASQKPCLISGLVLRQYLKTKHRASKSPLEWDELYCLPCRAGRQPAGLVVEAFSNTAKTTRLKGLCCQCGAVSSRIISNAKINVFAQIFQFRKDVGRNA